MTICLMAGGILGFFIATGLDVPSFEIVGYRNSVSRNAFVLPAEMPNVAPDLTGRLTEAASLTVAGQCSLLKKEQPI